MKKRLVLLLLLTASTFANPVDSAYSWITQEYKDFRTYPRVTKAINLIKVGHKNEARLLLEKALTIDTNNKNAIDLLLKICIDQKDYPCIEKYSSQSKDSYGLGYFYKNQAEKYNKTHDYTNAIKFSKKALKHKLKEDDKHLLELILFEAYLKSKDYKKADKLIDREHATIYNLHKWSKVSDNLKETTYAYRLASELPNKIKYIKWQINLLLKKELYEEASKKMELLYKREPSDENKQQLLYLYDLTHQSDNIVKMYQKKLKKGCNAYALEFLLNYYKKNKTRQRILLEKHYPYTCLSKVKQKRLSLQLIEYLKKSNPKKAKRLAKNMSQKVSNSKELIALYQTSGETKKLIALYKRQLQQGCNEYALLYLLNYYKNNKSSKKDILEKNYPYSCLSQSKRTQLTLELIALFEKEDSKKVDTLLSHLEHQEIDTSSYLYLSNLESQREHYQKAIEYATAYLKLYPNHPEALKNIGYAYFKLEKKNSALHYLEKASEVNPNDYELLKNIGYLSNDLELYDKAVHYWSQYLKKEKDSKIQFELASLYYYKLHQNKKADKALSEYERFSSDFSSEYYLLRGKLAHKNSDCPATLNYYEKALNSKKSEFLHYEYVHLLQQCNKNTLALQQMQQLSDDYPHKLQYQKELAYMYEHKKEYTQAIKNFKEIATKEPDKVENHTTLAYSYKRVGERKKAIDAFKKAIDYSKNSYKTQQRTIKREITNDSKLFHFYIAQSARLNSYKEGGKSLSPVNSASYNGFGSMQLSYQPSFLPKSTTLYANIIHNHKKVKNSIQPSIGIRHKPIKDKEIYLAVEQLVKTGDETRSDTLLRASLGISGTPRRGEEFHEELYLEAAHFVKENSNILYGNYELGKVYQIDKNTNIVPYVTTGGTYSNDNQNKASVTKLDVGLGVAINISSHETHYEVGKYRNKLKLEARQKYAGNSKDKQALRLQWEFFY